MQNSNQTGSHWISHSRKNNNIFIFDSFGIGYIPKNIYDIYKNFNIITNIYRIQHINFNLCGLFCVLFCLYKVNSKNKFIEFLNRCAMGVPQGSVLGPILFLIYINDLRNSSNTLSFSIFADDTSLLLSSIRDLYYETFMNELNKVTEWFSSNKLLLNYSKSQYIFFGPLYQTVYESEFILSDLYEVCPHFLLLDNSYSCLEEQLEDTSIKRKYVRGDPILKDLHLVAPDYLCKEHIITNNGILVEQNEVKYLGITFDNTLYFSTHINQITQKISKVVGILWKGRSLSLNIKLKIYYSLVYSHLSYAILVWGNCISNNITRGITNF